MRVPAGRVRRFVVPLDVWHHLTNALAVMHFFQGASCGQFMYIVHPCRGRASARECRTDGMIRAHLPHALPVCGPDESTSAGKSRHQDEASLRLGPTLTIARRCPFHSFGHAAALRICSPSESKLRIHRLVIRTSPSLPRRSRLACHWLLRSHRSVVLVAMPIARGPRMLS